MIPPAGPFTIRLDYAVKPRPRYGYGNPPHPQLTEILTHNKPLYQATLRSFAGLVEHLVKIPVSADTSHPVRPHWNNKWFEGIDALSVYGFLATTNPARYMEVGSGNSTKFARQAILDHGLKTKICSIDPYPRAEINSICDRIVRQPLEEVDVAIVDELEAGDVLMVDNSHRVFTNSDATVVFMDIIPRLKPGVLIGIHDIMLPLDYPPRWNDRFYSEQYVLAAYLLARGPLLEVVLPCKFIAMNEDLMVCMQPIWDRLPLANPYGSAFWLRRC